MVILMLLIMSDVVSVRDDVSTMYYVMCCVAPAETHFAVQYITALCLCLASANLKSNGKTGFPLYSAVYTVTSIDAGLVKSLDDVYFC